MMENQTDNTKKTLPKAPSDKAETQTQKPVIKDKPLVEKGGPKGPEPTRFGDWESGGRCTDF